MYPVLFQVVGIPIESFWVAVFAGFLAALWVARRELARQGHDPGAAYDLVLWAYVGGFVGARAFLVVTAWVQVQRDHFGLLPSVSCLVLPCGVRRGPVAVVDEAPARR